MAEERNKETSAKQFLLGKLSGDRLTSLEENFFTDDEVFEELEIAEDEIIDAYVRNELSAKDRSYFEEKLLRSPRIAERVRVAKVFATATPAYQPSQVTKTRFDWKSWLWPTSSFGKLAFASLSVLVLVGSAGLTIDWLRLREQSKRLRDEQATLERRIQDLTSEKSMDSAERDRLTKELQDQLAKNAKLTEEVERQFERPTQPAVILPLTLFPGSSRSSSAANSLRLHPSAVNFAFNLLLETDEHPTYEAIVTKVGGAEVGRRSGLKSRSTGKGRTVSFRLSSTRFVPGDYVIELSGVTATGQTESIAEYTFRVLAAN